MHLAFLDLKKKGHNYRCGGPLNQLWGQCLILKDVFDTGNTGSEISKHRAYSNPADYNAVAWNTADNALDEVLACAGLLKQMFRLCPK